MPTRRLLLLGLALACVLVAAACLPWGVATGPAGGRVDRDLRAAYGIGLAASGATAFTLLPWPHLTFRDVALANGERPLARSAVLTVHLALLPLVAGRAEVSEIALDGARITLAEGPGDDRWDLALRRLARQAVVDPAVVDPAVVDPAGADPVAAPSGAPSPVAHLRRLTLRRSTLVGLDPRTGRPETAEDVTLTATWPKPGAALEAWGSLAWHGRAVRFGLGDLRPADALSGRPTPFHAQVSWPAGSLALEGRGILVGVPAVAGRAHLDTGPLGETLAWLGADVALAPLVGTLAIDASYRVGEDGVVLPSLSVAAGTNRLDGAGGLAVQDGRLAVTATLAADTLDLAALLPPLRDSLGAAGWSRAPIALDRFTGCDLDLRLSAGTAGLGALRLEDVAAGLQVREGGIEASVGRAGLRGGVVKGRLGLAEGGHGTELRAGGSFDRVDLGALLADLGAPFRMAGQAQGQLALEGAGASVDALVRRLGGRAALSLRDGELSGIDLGSAFARAGAGLPALAPAQRDGRTPFARADLAATFTDGVGTVTEAALHAPALQARLAGRLSLPERSLRARAELLPEGGRGAALFDVAGPWTALTASSAGLVPPGAEASALPAPEKLALPPRASADAP